MPLWKSCTFLTTDKPTNTEDNRGVISADKLAEGLGPCISTQAIRNSAFEGLLPLGLGTESI
jgi:hypothetical protein